MKKEDYKLIAQCIRGLGQDACKPYHIAVQFATSLGMKSEDAEFDETQFMKDCGWRE